MKICLNSLEARAVSYGNEYLRFESGIYEVLELESKIE
jgi:hypothetical protein